jgi:ferrochelatase
MQTTPIGIMVLAYGTPETLDDVEPYYTHIRGGRPPSPEALENLRERYRLIGGRTPLLDLTKSVAEQLQARFDRDVPGQYKVYLGMKHWHPFIGDVVRQMLADGIEQVVAVVLAPHYSRYSLEGYRKYITKALEQNEREWQLTFIESWHDHPDFHRLIADRIEQQLNLFDPADRDQVTLLFSAHSLPEKIVTMADPYPELLHSSAAAVAHVLGRDEWRFCYQSAGQTGEPWLGPDILDYLDELHAEGVRQIVSAPFGFVADHLEVVWDIDTEAQQKAAELGMILRRIEMPNADPEFVDLIEKIVLERGGLT